MSRQMMLSELFICIITEGTAYMDSIFLNHLPPHPSHPVGENTHSHLPSIAEELKLKSKLKDEVVSK